MNDAEFSQYLIIGAGPGGYKMVADLAAEGKSVTIIEKGLLGGTCLNRGCIPTKCLCASASVLDTIRSAEIFGVVTDGVRADYGKAHERTVSVVDSLRSDIKMMLRGVKIVSGEAKFVADKTVAVGEQLYTADKIVIATGSRPAQLRCEGADKAIDSDGFLALNHLPEGPVVIVGGGVIGLEFAGILNSFGLDVTVVEFCKEVLPGLDSELAKRLRSRMSRNGIKFMTSTAVKEIADGKVVAEGRKGLVEIEVATVIAAVGRRPILPEGLDVTAIRLTEKGFIAVDLQTFETTVSGVYAVGDVNGLCMLAHAAEVQAAVVAGKVVKTSPMPSVVFTHPEFASVGSFDGYASVKVPYGSNGKALAEGEDEGILKLVYDAESGRVVGCHVLGAHAADLVAEATLAIAKGMTLSDVASTIHAHPTLSELVRTAAEQALGTTK